MSALLDRLEGLKQTGPDRWLARCPGHDDKSPSLSLRRVHDRWLVHCFAGCDASDVLAAVGLSLSDLFSRPLAHQHKPVRTSHSHAAILALRTLRSDSLFVAICGERVAEGNILTAEDRDKLCAAVGRIRRIARMVA